MTDDLVRERLKYLLSIPHSKWDGADKNFVAQIYKAQMKMPSDKRTYDFSALTDDDLLSAFDEDGDAKH